MSVPMLIQPAPLIDTLAKMQLSAKSNGNLLNEVILLLENNQFVLYKLLDLSIRILGNLETHKLQGKKSQQFLMTQLDYT